MQQQQQPPSPPHPTQRPHQAVGAALMLAALMALANYLIWGWASAPAAMLRDAPNLPARVHGVAYAPFARADAPWVRHAPAAALIDTDLQQLASVTGEIRTYSAAQLPELPALAQRHQLRLTLGVWLNRDAANNEREISAALQAAHTHPNVTRLVVGNETVLSKVLSPAQLASYLQRVRATARVPVSTAEPWHVWIKHPELAAQVDFITVHLLPYWEGVGIDTAVEESFERLARVRARFPGKAVLIGEIGYPSSGDTIKRARPSPAAQAAFVRQFVARAQRDKLDYFLMEAYDQPWKQHEEGRAGAYWGMFDAARVAKFSFSGPIEPDPYWRAKALGSSGAGLLLLLWFLTRFASLRPLARCAFAAAAQAVLSSATVLLTLPLLHYMQPSDWAMLALLIATSLVMVAILLAHLFEFVELFWDGSLHRRFAPQPLPATTPQPFVSIHLACCNEPPDMVIAAIKSLAALDYQAYEVLIVDNNTADPALWQPVRDFTATLPPHFRFFHLPAWPGFKAGALNYALTHTAAEAEVIAVVDADYLVRPQWLASLAGHFGDPQVGIVQAPQAHRDWGTQVFRKMMNWEYDGFFRIGMHHRNERDAIIQHGTMTLIRASALRTHGAWSEWCLCEDTELGLRLMQQNLRTVYVDEVMGEGLTPDSFAAFKKQRQRWAQGGMQIARAHWRALWGRSPPAHEGRSPPAHEGRRPPAHEGRRPPAHEGRSSPAHEGRSLPAHEGRSPLLDQGRSRLTLGQRYHFLAGWLPWIGDALHLVFVIAALGWTLGVLALPNWFSLPVALLMLPLGGFCAAKLVIGPLLYWRRVPCSAGGIAGAAIAGMALSHAIARGVLAGLFGGAGVFHITSKGGAAVAAKTPPQRNTWLTRIIAPAREELLLLTALATAIAVIGLTRSSGHVESALWMLILGLQSLPYVAALLCAVAAALPARRGAASTASARPAGPPQPQSSLRS